MSDYTCNVCNKSFKFDEVLNHHQTHLLQEEVKETIEVIKETREFTAEGSITAYEGQQRSGKTLTGTMFALEAHKVKKLPVWSTLGFRFPYIPLNFNKMKLDNEVSPLTDGHIFIDELNFYLDARGAMTKLNKDFCKFLLQVKKQGLSLTGTTHKLSYLDLRFRQNYDFKILPEVFPKYPERPVIMKWTILNGPVKSKMNRTVKMKVEPFLGLYDTRHVFNAFEPTPQSATTVALQKLAAKPKPISPPETKPTRFEI